MPDNVTPAAPAAASASPAAPAAPAAAPVTPPAAAVDWVSGLPDTDKGYVQNKGWKAPTDVLSGYQHLEKLVGLPAERTVILPKTDDKAEWEQVFSKIGRPAKAEDYKFPEAKTGNDPEFVKWAQSAFHEAGLSNKQAAAIVEKWNANQVSMNENLTKSYNEKVALEQAALKKEWGMAHDQNMELAKRAAAEFDLSTEDWEGLEKSLGLAKTLKLFHQIGAKAGESSFVSGSKNSGGMMTPEAARQEFNTLMQDEAWVRKFGQGDASARQEKERLERFMYPELHS